MAKSKNEKEVEVAKEKIETVVEVQADKLEPVQADKVAPVEIAQVETVEPVVALQEKPEKKQNIVLNKQESITMGNLLKNGMSFTDARKKILDARKPTKLVDVKDAEISQAKKEIKLGKKDEERKLHLCNLLGMGKSMEKAMLLAYGEGCKNIDGRIYTKEQLKLIEN